jgi:hypothetical protein
MDDIVQFPRAKPLTEEQALARVREVREVESISALAALLNWERTRTQRALIRWEQDGAIVRKPGGPGGKTMIEAVVGGLPAVRAAAQPPVWIARCAPARAP